ncbi:class E sortase [Streptomyces roseicoloratus]|uniref:Class E sortase n=1 Tax=Streptomyces roseicoloratus TaxID=2508722 RepID=A0ABY9RPZ1_9ACTN|nr:class E sortase [Streptomyces roseicoloratus]WMX43982.1 class E sortase [Streptomyces roseicoloratus]
MTRSRRTRTGVAAALAAAVLGAGAGALTGCTPTDLAGPGSGPGSSVAPPATAPAAPPVAVSPVVPPSPPGPVSPATAPAASTPPASVARPAPPAPPAPSETAVRPPVAELDIPSIGVDDLRVVPYEGTTDDRPGTRIQDRGIAASPYGKRGGVGPGDVGNYLVTAHRLSAGGPLRELPDVDVGDKVLVTAEGRVYEYRITDTRSTSFRSARSLAEQRAPVPGSPGERPTQAMITLSTCATPEDDAAGNTWRDAQGNPEHRIDKVGVLVSVRPGP